MSKRAAWMRAASRNIQAKHARRWIKSGAGVASAKNELLPIVVENVNGLTLTVRPAEEWEVAP